MLNSHLVVTFFFQFSFSSNKEANKHLYTGDSNITEIRSKPKMTTHESEMAFLALQEENRLLKKMIAEKDDIINDLRSQVDKYKSVLSMCDVFPLPGADPQLKPRKERLMGISAEPESSLTYEELLQTKFADYKKTER